MDKPLCIEDEGIGYFKINNLLFSQWLQKQFSLRCSGTHPYFTTIFAKEDNLCFPGWHYIFQMRSTPVGNNLLLRGQILSIKSWCQLRRKENLKLAEFPWMRASWPVWDRKKIFVGLDDLPCSWIHMHLIMLIFAFASVCIYMQRNVLSCKHV